MAKQKTPSKQLIEDNDRLFAKNQYLKNLLTSSLYEIARYQGSLEARREALKQHESLAYLVAELDSEIKRIESFRLEIKLAIFDKN